MPKAKPLPERKTKVYLDRVRRLVWILESGRCIFVEPKKPITVHASSEVDVSEMFDYTDRYHDSDVACLFLQYAIDMGATEEVVGILAKTIKIPKTTQAEIIDKGNIYFNPEKAPRKAPARKKSAIATAYDLTKVPEEPPADGRRRLGQRPKDRVKHLPDVPLRKGVGKTLPVGPKKAAGNAQKPAVAAKTDAKPTSPSQKPRKKA